MLEIVKRLLSSLSGIGKFDSEIFDSEIFDSEIFRIYYCNIYHEIFAIAIIASTNIFAICKILTAKTAMM